MSVSGRSFHFSASQQAQIVLIRPMARIVQSTRQEEFGTAQPVLYLLGEATPYGATGEPMLGSKMRAHPLLLKAGPIL